MPEIIDSKERKVALDPSKSLLIQAPAGSGKTELLIQRYLRLLSGVEHRMNSSYVMLNQLLDDAKDIDGIIIYSMFMLPRQREIRNKMIGRLIDNGKEIHAAVEDLILKDSSDYNRLDNIFLVDNVLESNYHEEVRYGITEFCSRNP